MRNQHGPGHYATADDLIAWGPDRLQWWFGYALDDGMWRTHSWVLRTADGKLLETTGSREGYIGVHLPPELYGHLAFGF